MFVKIKVLGLFACCAALLATAVSAPASPLSRKLYCVAGGGMTATVRHLLGPGGGTSVEIDFQRADGTNPGPGQCAWSDGGMSRMDPSSMAFVAPPTGVDFTLGAGSALTNLTTHGGSDDVQIAIKDLLYKVSSGGQIVVDVYEYKPIMQITKVY